MATIEYRVRPVTRYVVTRYHSDPEERTGGCESLGEFANMDQANNVAEAMSKNESGATFSRLIDAGTVGPVSGYVHRESSSA